MELNTELFASFQLLDADDLGGLVSSCLSENVCENASHPISCQVKGDGQKEKWRWFSFKALHWSRTGSLLLSPLGILHCPHFHTRCPTSKLINRSSTAQTWECSCPALPCPALPYTTYL